MLFVQDRCCSGVKCIGVCVCVPALASQCSSVLSHYKCQLTRSGVDIDVVPWCVPALRLVVDVKPAT